MALKWKIEIKKLIFYLAVSLLTSGILFPPAALAQTSIIEQMMETQSAIVQVEATIVGVFKAPQASPVFDPQSRQILLIQKVAQGQYQRSGSGVIIHSSGIIVTNAHTVADANFIQITLHNGQKINAQIISYINDLDLAFLKIQIPNPLPAVALADSDAVELDDEIITIGNSDFLQQTVSGGKVTGLGVSRTSQENGVKRTDLIQTSIDVYKGDSGGPLFDRKGHLIGLITAKETTTTHSSFAIPSNKIKFYLEEYLKK